MQEILNTILSEVDNCTLECDGITRVISMLFRSAGIEHAVYLGEITSILNNQTVKPHYWIQIDEGIMIDFRAKMWLGDLPGIPHGAFTSSSITGHVLYCGKICSPYPADDPIGKILATIEGIDIRNIADKLRFFT